MSFIIKNDSRWRVCAINADGHVQFHNVYDDEQSARQHARLNDKRQLGGRRWVALQLTPRDEFDISFGRKTIDPA